MRNARNTNRSAELSEPTKSIGTVEAVEENRTHLEALAESDLPASWIAEALLEATDDDGGSSYE